VSKGAMSRRKKLGRPRKRRRNYKREYEMAHSNGDRHVGAPKGSQNGLSHGIFAFRNQVKRRARRGRSLINRNTRAGKNAVATGDELLRDLGGEENCSTAKLMLVEMIRRDTYFCDEIDARIFRAINKVSAAEKALIRAGKIKNPKFIATLYGYRQTVVNNLARNLLALGLEKAPPKVKTLEEILNEGENEQEATDGNE
jgi:hypothetical protein